MFNTMLGVKVSKQNRELLEKVCRLRGEDLSSFIRRAILKELAELGFLDSKQKQALGLD